MKQYTRRWADAITPYGEANRLGIISNDKDVAMVLVKNVIQRVPRAQLVEKIKFTMYNTLDINIREVPIKVHPDGHADLIMPDRFKAFIDECDIVVIIHRHYGGKLHYTTIKDMKD